MTSSQDYGCWMPFPAIPERVREQHCVNNLFLRPFGQKENDLEVDFSQKLRPYLVTRILECCTYDQDRQVPERGFFEDLTVGKRIECLMTVVMTGRASGIPVHLRCSDQACREPMEIEFSMDEMTALQHQSDDTDPLAVRIDGRTFEFRKPTGGDQLDWLKGSFPNEDAAVKTMIQTLLCSDDRSSDHEFQIPDEWVRIIDEALAETDPLVNFSLTVRCPHCSEDGLYSINLEESLIRELHMAQLNLIRTVHRLATYYHWAEEQVLSIPSWRRRHYLALIEKEGG